MHEVTRAATFTLVSLSTWIGNPTDQNHHGVAAKLYAKDITDYDLSVILPTGWNRTIQTVSLTGQQISTRLLLVTMPITGKGTRVLVSPVQPEAGKTYQAASAVRGATKVGCAENHLSQTAVWWVWMLRASLRTYTTISRADTAWS